MLEAIEFDGKPHLLDIDFTNFEVVYFIHASDTNLVKIGWTHDIGRRFRQFQTACPHSLGLLAIHPGGKSLEQAYHQEFAAYRQSGEWFHLVGEIRWWLWMYLRNQFLVEWKSLIRHDREIARSASSDRSREFMNDHNRDYLKGIPDEIGNGYGI